MLSSVTLISFKVKNSILYTMMCDVITCCEHSCEDIDSKIVPRKVYS